MSVHALASPATTRSASNGDGACIAGGDGGGVHGGVDWIQRLRWMRMKGGKWVGTAAGAGSVSVKVTIGKMSKKGTNVLFVERDLKPNPTEDAVSFTPAHPSPTQQRRQLFNVLDHQQKQFDGSSKLDFGD
ncbi:hypothetical protein H0H92_013524 [Tricholoma furcatifolium]|nr:hypothetical protein H0H92_013524 [Tricholoma furcatifolium]